MELKVWVDGLQRVVCGISESSTCQEVIYALAHATGKTGRFVLVERWRNSERSLAPFDHPLQLLSKWGEYAADVQFVLHCLQEPPSLNSNSNSSSNNEPCSSSSSLPSRPLVNLPEASMKRSVTFSSSTEQQREAGLVVQKNALHSPLENRPTGLMVSSHSVHDSVNLRGTSNSYPVSGSAGFQSPHIYAGANLPPALDRMPMPSMRPPPPSYDEVMSGRPSKTFSTRTYSPNPNLKTVGGGSSPMTSIGPLAVARPTCNAYGSGQLNRDQLVNLIENQRLVLARQQQILLNLDTGAIR
ncbi:unnamed protein product [Soboliphyme baturini]|uniref:Ras-associating domain-containing protein n=1 Tax=Soboliphyme baturini TaxID=241478 RepID=A0A183J9W1_9BILA|nr:unnamed protein product [Soboliphyme baturini]